MSPNSRRRAGAPPRPCTPPLHGSPHGRRSRAGLAAILTACLLTIPIPGWLPDASAQSSFVITFDELPQQPVDGLTVKGASFGFTGGAATFNDTGPGGLFFSDASVLRGDANGILVLDFAQPTPTLSFAAALNSTSFAATPGLTIDLFGIGLVPLGTLTLPLISQGQGLWMEGEFIYPGGPPITRAVIDFLEGNAGDPAEFLIDNLGFSTLPPARRASPDPQPFLLIDHLAIRSTNTSGLMMPAVHQQLLRGSARTALRDLNARLYRARANHPARIATRRVEQGASVAPYLDFTAGKNPSYKIPLGLQDDQTGDIPTPTVVARTAVEIFASVDYGHMSQDNLSRVFRGYDADTWAGSLGVEWRPTDWAALGLAYSRVSTDAKLDGGLGSANLDANLYSFYGTVFHGNSWADLLYSYGDFSSELKRNTLVGDAGRGDPDSRVHHLFLNVGHQIPLNPRTVTGPMLGLDYLSGRTGAYTESGSPRANLLYDSQSFDSLISRVGWQLTRRQELSWGILELQGRIAWEKEHRPANDTVRATLATSPFLLVSPGEGAQRVGGYAASAPSAHPGTDWLTLGTGLRLGFRNDLSLLLDYEGQFFQNNLTIHYGSIKLSWEF